MSRMILPTPASAFVWREMPPGPALVCTPLAELAPHFFSTRVWSDAGDAGWRDAAAAAAAIDLSIDRLVRVDQPHGANVAVVRGGSPTRLDADIIVSSETEVALAVRIADCVPLLVADRRTGAVAAAHAGWRGLAARVPRETVSAMIRVFGSRPEDLVAAAGPSIGPCCYEIGVDVRGAFEAAGFGPDALARWFAREAPALPANPRMTGVEGSGRDGHWFFDAWQAARDQLREAGVPEGQIFVAETCTASHPIFCSYRRDGVGAGRLAAVIRPSRHPSRYSPDDPRARSTPGARVRS